jgi:hypothetical protein
MSCARLKDGVKAAHMKTHLQLISNNGKTLGTLDLQRSTMRNLEAFAKKNKLPLVNMIDLAIRFTTNPEKRSINLTCPDERALT